MVHMNILFSVTFADLLEVIHGPHKFLSTARNHSTGFRKVLNLAFQIFSDEEYTT